MKKLSFGAIIIVFAVLAGAYFYGPTSDVEYSLTETGIGNFKDSVQPVKFALISDIHFRESPRAEITNEEVTRAILNEFMESMNTDVKPDFIVQLGDLIDGCVEFCTGGAPEDLIIDRLRRAQRYSKGKTDITWFDVIGNHEYASGYTSGLSVIENKDYGAVYRAINKDWSSLEDTWYYRDIKGYRFIFLNTSFPYKGLPHMIPLEEVNWLKGVLDSSNKPTFVFMHVPVSGGTGGRYDLAVNREMIIELLANDDSFVAGFFGHSHHSDKWDGLRKQLDPEGNIYFHVPAPHEWMGDRAQHPWVLVTIEPGEDRFTVEAGKGIKRSELSEIFNYVKERLVKIALRLTSS